MSKTVRMLRILEYEGSPEWVLQQVEGRKLKGSIRFGDGVIREAMVGEVPQLIDGGEDDADETRRPH